MYRIEWLPDAEAELTEIWLAGRDRQAVTEAAEQLDQQLSADPLSVGESRSSGRRIVFVRPLGATFRVLTDQKTVIVSRVWRVR
jgi:plasmid stabilization system protein ParE